MANPQEVSTFIREHSFGILLTVADQEIHNTYTPFLFSQESQTLQGHIAKANPQWRSWDQSTTAKAVFTGPHAYVSPSYYTSDLNVPTWNYTSVTVTGPLSIVSNEDEVVAFMDGLVAQHETGRGVPWSFDHSDHRYRQLLANIVVFQVEALQVDAAFKLNQNKSVEDQQSVMGHLKQSTSAVERQVAALMARNLPSS